MADLLDGIARHLHAAGHVTYDPTGTGGDCYIESMPPEPAAAVGLWLYSGGPQDAALAYDMPRLQVRTRGGPDPRTSRARAAAIYAELHGLANIELPDGTALILCAAVGTPAPMGPDASGRHEHVCSYALDVATEPTAHRT